METTKAVLLRKDFFDLTALVRSIQYAEGLSDCFRQLQGSCDQVDCTWRKYRYATTCSDDRALTHMALSSLLRPAESEFLSEIQCADSFIQTGLLIENNVRQVMTERSFAWV